MPSFARGLLILALVGAILAGATAAIVVTVDRYRSRPENVHLFPIGDEVRYDDFAFSVVRAREESEVATPTGPVHPRGRFVVVTMRVANHAKRVGYRFRPSTIFLLAGDGREFGIAPAVPVIGCASELPAGSTCTADLAFDVPADTGPLRARVGTSHTVLDMLDRVVFGRNELALE